MAGTNCITIMHLHNIHIVWPWSPGVSIFWWQPLHIFSTMPCNDFMVHKIYGLYGLWIYFVGELDCITQWDDICKSLVIYIPKPGCYCLYTLFPIVQDKDGRNALHLASLSGHASLARDLVTMYRLHPSTTSKVLESCVDTVMSEFRYLSQILY